jgi:hypothetical protein
MTLIFIANVMLMTRATLGSFQLRMPSGDLSNTGWHVSGLFILGSPASVWHSEFPFHSALGALNQKSLTNNFESVAWRSVNWERRWLTIIPSPQCHHMVKMWDRTGLLIPQPNGPWLIHFSFISTFVISLNPVLGPRVYIMHGEAQTEYGTVDWTTPRYRAKVIDRRRAG